MFTNPFTLDPADANHLITAGTKVYETTKGTGTTTADWKQVFDLGTTVGRRPDVGDRRARAWIPARRGSDRPHTANFNYTGGGTPSRAGSSGAPSTCPAPTTTTRSPSARTTATPP